MQKQFIHNAKFKKLHPINNHSKFMIMYVTNCLNISVLFELFPMKVKINDQNMITKNEFNSEKSKPV